VAVDPSDSGSRLLFVLSDMRSGSTLLDQLLGAHPEITSLGELHWLAAYVTQDRGMYDPDHELVCTCGRPVRECPFWGAVARCLRRPLESLQLQVVFTRAGRYLAHHLPGICRYQLLRRMLTGSRMVEDTIALVDCLFKVSQRRFLVDSSKSPYRFRAIHDARPAQVLGLILTRDYRAVVHSKMKRGQSLESAAIGWRNRMRQIAVLTDDLPRDRICCLRYEDLCQYPRREIERLCGFLGIAFTSAMLHRPTAGIHHIGGSPSKFDTTRTDIAIDDAHESAFTASELDHLASLVGNMADRWGY
jgi:hypothetical protein